MQLDEHLIMWAKTFLGSDVTIVVFPLDLILTQFFIKNLILIPFRFFCPNSSALVCDWIREDINFSTLGVKTLNKWASVNISGTNWKSIGNSCAMHFQCVPLNFMCPTTPKQCILMYRINCGQAPKYITDDLVSTVAATAT